MDVFSKEINRLISKGMSTDVNRLISKGMSTDVLKTCRKSKFLEKKI